MRQLKGKIKRIVTVFLCTVLLISIEITGSAQKLSDRYGEIYPEEVSFVETAPYYADVLAKATGAGMQPAPAGILLDLKKARINGEAANISVINDKNCIITEDEQSLTLPFFAGQNGLYAVEIEYIITDDLGLPARRSVYVDDKIYFQEAQNIALYPRFAPKAEEKFDENGNQLHSPATLIKEWQTVRLYDDAGAVQEPLLWEISAGEHIFELRYGARPVTIAAIRLCPPESVRSYAEVKAEYEAKGFKPSAQSAEFEAESPMNLTAMSEDTMLYFSDNDPKMTPVAKRSLIFNAVGGQNWQAGGQTLWFKLNAPETGLYTISLRILQNWKSNMPSCRRIAIDGKVPFEEMLTYGFDFDRQWRIETLSGENEAYLFYFEKGTHTISLSPVVHPAAAETMRQLGDANDALSEIYRKILMITGSAPDPNYEYELDKSIPEMVPVFTSIIEDLMSADKALSVITDGKAEANSQLKMLVSQITGMKNGPKTIAWKLDDFSNAMTSMGSLAAMFLQSPLALDKILLDLPGAQIDDGRSGFLERCWVAIRAFFYSFFDDYSATQKNQLENRKELSVWVSRGKEWVIPMEDLIRSDFEVNAKIKVNLNVLPSGALTGTINPLLLALTSGKGPDAVINMSAELPVEYGIREAAADISKLEGFAEYAKGFHPEIFKSFTFQGGIYAAPETMNFYVMIYRKDIFSSLGLQPPKTWDEVNYRLLPVLYQKNMQMMPAPFDLLLYQMGGTVYSEDGLRSALGKSQAQAAFSHYMNQFQDLGYPIASNFFNRFRTGEMPIGFVDYTTYVQIIAAAPELASKWALAPVPGTVQEDGSVDHSTTPLAITANMLMKSSKSPNEAWEFIKWWGGSQVQASYGRRLENALGAGARWNPATIAAYDSLPWSRSDMAAIKSCWADTKVVPYVLGGVITTRSLTNAMNAVLYNGVTPRVALEEATAIIDQELLRKQELYGINRDK